MKKFIALAMVALMLVALAVPCFAADHETIVEYKVDETYTFVVPAKITLVADGSAPAKIEAECVLIPGNKLVITADSTWKLNDAAETAFQFSMTEFSFETTGAQDFGVSFVNGAPTVPAVDPYTATVTFTGAIEVAPQ